MDTKKRIIHKSLLKPLALTMGALTLACLLQGCGGEDSQTPSQNTSPTDTSWVTEVTGTSTPTNSSSTNQTDPTASLRTYYENLISELRQELLDEREDRYISDHQYQNRLEALEETIAALEKALDTPTGGTPTTDAPSDTSTDTETETPAPSVFTYSVSNGQACITAYTGTSETVNVPAEIDGYTVVAIGDQAFQNTPVRSVILPATVREVGWFAFGGCYGLELVSIPTSVEKINYGAFDGCPQVVILCAADSYASAYAVSFGLAHQYV